MDKLCTVCVLRANRGELPRDEIKLALEGVQELRLCEDHAGEVVSIVLGQIPPKDPPDLLEKVLADPEKATKDELMQGFVLASQRTHPDLDDQMEW